MRRNERGAVGVWAAVMIPGFIVCVGLGVDLAGHAKAEQELRAVAAEAARAGGQYLVITPGTRPHPQTGRAQRAATTFLAASGFDSSTTVSTDGSIHVEVRGRYQTHFLQLIGVKTLPLTGSASAHVASVVDGEER